MQRAAIAATFVDEPVIIGSVQLTDTEGKEYRHELVLESISLGCLERICSFIAPTTPLIKELAQSDTENRLKVRTGDVLQSSLYNLAKVIVLACDNSQAPLSMSLVDAVHDQFTVLDIHYALEAVTAKINFRGLSDHYQFKPSTDKTVYPGSSSPWSLLVNAMVSFKGCNEYDLKWNMSYVNLLMYCSTLSSSRLANSDGGKPAEGKEVDMWDLFNGISKESD
ncbi:hypothetical protein [Sphingobacterium multivorum]|uniref:hypothetical protein n=1 Tax=Sphingobacterium multivorum TaxID=28454 RepID=UPI0028B0024C|nr:hypothetical protein [Sphingobacterium multivorum]